MTPHKHENFRALMNCVLRRLGLFLIAFIVVCLVVGVALLAGGAWLAGG